MPRINSKIHESPRVSYWHMSRTMQQLFIPRALRTPTSTVEGNHFPQLTIAFIQALVSYKLNLTPGTMVDTRSKGAPIAKKLSNGCPAKWSPSKRADMLQILKQEKVNDNTKFSLSKNSKVWQKVSKELIDDDEQKTPKRCCFHFMNMKREAGYIEHALKLEGVTWNKKTSMLEPVEGALDGVCRMADANDRGRGDVS